MCASKRDILTLSRAHGHSLNPIPFGASEEICTECRNMLLFRNFPSTMSESLQSQAAHSCRIKLHILLTFSVRVRTFKKVVGTWEDGTQTLVGVAIQNEAEVL